VLKEEIGQIEIANCKVMWLKEEKDRLLIAR
jgi:hypothetical protein